MELPNIILLFENSVKLNLILDYLFDKNVPFGVEKKVLNRIRIYPKWEEYDLIQLYRAWFLVL